jgi:hypothetical protein
MYNQRKLSEYIPLYTAGTMGCYANNSRIKSDYNIGYVKSGLEEYNGCSH